MKFIIEYTGNSEQNTLIYLEDEYSFFMESKVQAIDFYIVINTLTLTVIDGKVAKIDGFCGLNKKMKANYGTLKSQKGELKVLCPEKYWDGVGCYRVNNEDWPVYVNVQTGWVCIGDPEKKSNAVEFINNCVAVIDDDQQFVALWLKPLKLPDL